MQAGGGSAGLAMLDWLDETGADNDSCHYHNDNGAILTPICFARSIANEIHTQGHVRMAPAARLAPGRQLPAGRSTRIRRAPCAALPPRARRARARLLARG